MQWKEELAKHAPTLKVYMYQGYEKLEVPITKDDVEALKKKRKMKSKKNSKAREDPVDEDEEEEVLEWVHFINQFDVCIVNYDVLRGDLYVARPPVCYLTWVVIIGMVFIELCSPLDLDERMSSTETSADLVAPSCLSSGSGS